MRKIFSTLLLFLLFFACQKEQLKEEIAKTDGLLPKTFKSADDVFSFLSTEMPEMYTPTEITRIKSILEEPETDVLKRSSNTVELPAGSVDALQAAIDEAGPGGTVLVKSGEHAENGLVTIGHRINLIGEVGAIININNAVEDLYDLEFQLSKGIRIVNADRTLIKGIHFTTTQDASGMALYIDHSNRVYIHNNQFSKFLYTIQVNYGNNNSIRGNQLTSAMAGALGIVIINGRHSSIIDNEVSGMQFGIWACDKGGVSWGNVATGCYYGQILCKVPAGYYDYDGNLLEAESSGNHWLIAKNNSSNNFYAGIVAIDGAHDNVILANTGSGNNDYDVDLAGRNLRFGFYVPTSSKNIVYSYNDQTVKDCGENNKVVGGIQVDTSVDECDNVEPQ
ncbi:MAG: hypothetical protein KDC53_19045 [Saprospiraceae bacterium]|nr:hypothetical protein [Saprospiraceae bacterium]